MQDRGSQISAV